MFHLLLLAPLAPAQGSFTSKDSQSPSVPAQSPLPTPSMAPEPCPSPGTAQSPLPAPSTERRKESVCTSGLTVCFLVILQRMQVSSMWPRADVMNTMKAFSWIAGSTDNRFPAQSKPGAQGECGAGFGRALCSAGTPVGSWQKKGKAQLHKLLVLPQDPLEGYKSTWKIYPKVPGRCFCALGPSLQRTVNSGTLGSSAALPLLF